MRRSRNSSKAFEGNPAMGQFFTPAPVGQFMWRAIQCFMDGEVGTNLKVIDPAAGRGDILQAVIEEGEVERWVYGIEIDPELVRQQICRAIQNRFYTGDGLADLFPGVSPGSFDVVVGNPPFGRLAEILPHKTSVEKIAQFGLWQAGRKINQGGVGKVKKDGIAIELLFVERALQLLKPGGLVALIMPEGFFANKRLQAARDWVLERAELLGVVALPDAVFCRPGLRATTSIVFLRKIFRPKKKSATVLLVGAKRNRTGKSLGQSLALTLRSLRALHRGGKSSDGLRVPAPSLKGKRWDVKFWHGAVGMQKLSQRFSLAPLGEYIGHLTYGPIVTGRRPQHREGGIKIIRQGDFTETGLQLDQVLCVCENSVYDPLRSRVCQGDLLLPRSGAGSLGKNRLAVYTEKDPANIGCFVDLIRLVEINAFYVWFFLKTQMGWQQIRAIMNGVGTPNINFSEIRALLIPQIPIEEQGHFQKRYIEEVWPLHCRRQEGNDICSEAEKRFRKIVMDLEYFLGFGARASGR